ncbi:MAG TPA: nucleotidyltransferase family protein [Candidatus Acidoferrales bacterium]|nr:nucleotidyltransferase family protein [Candidatus Acidoferrales bacterium]
MEPRPSSRRPGAVSLPLGAVILGAGTSSRMGRPKLLLPWHNTTVIGHLIGQWQALAAAQIAVVHRPNDLALAAELDRLRFPRADRIENPQPERGMFSSVVCAANWPGWNPGLSAWAIVLGDQPHLRPETLRKLLEFHAPNPAAVCQPAFDGQPKHPVILPPGAFCQLRTSQAGSLKEFLKQIPCPSVQYSADDPGLLLDMDTPEDYKRALQSP